MNIHRPSRLMMKCFSIIGTSAVLTWSACSSDQLPELIPAVCDTEEFTYTVDIEPIIETACAYSGCHLDNAPGNFDSYAGLLPYLDNNSFRQRVIIERTDATTGMPPNYAPIDRPIDLTPEELTMVECWLDAGYPE